MYDIKMGYIYIPIMLYKKYNRNYKIIFIIFFQFNPCIKKNCINNHFYLYNFKIFNIQFCIEKTFLMTNYYTNL